MLEGHRDHEAETDSKRRPHLPHHGERSPDRLGRGFGRVHGRGARLCAHGKAEHESSREQVAKPFPSSLVTTNERHGVAAGINTYESATAIQKPVTTDMKHEMKIVNLRPPILFRIGFVQHPMSAEQRYGAPFIRPCNRGSLKPNSS